MEQAAGWTNKKVQRSPYLLALARAATLLVVLGATRAYAADIGYLAPPGVPAKEFPSPRRPVAQIVSPSRSAEAHRDSLDEAGEVARRVKLKPGMMVGDIGAGSASRASSVPPAP